MELLSKKVNAHSDRINSVAFSPDGTKIVSVSDDHTIKIWRSRRVSGGVDGDEDEDDEEGNEDEDNEEEDDAEHDDEDSSDDDDDDEEEDEDEDEDENEDENENSNGNGDNEDEDADKDKDEDEDEDVGAPEPSNCPSLTKADACWLIWQTRWSCGAKSRRPTAAGSCPSRFPRTGPRSCPDRSTRLSKSGMLVCWSPQNHPSSARH